MRGRAAAARGAHNPEVGGSSPPPATKKEASREIQVRRKTHSKREMGLRSFSSKTSFRMTR